MNSNRKLYLALPVLNEYENLPAFIECLRKQNFRHFELVVCVNNFNDWWEVQEKASLCIDNQHSLDYLNSIEDIKIHLIDKSTKGKGWPGKKGGVGWARKVAMDYVSQISDAEDVIVCMDADTYYPKNYLSSIAESFDKDEKLDGIAIPYYHKLMGGITDRLILRYEIYMRNYLLNLININNPYAFTALGSAMAVSIKAYRKIGGMTPMKSGEDFYFLQKLVKNGSLGIWAETIAYPSARLSDRVIFGTGPALIKGNKGDWDSYPIYHADSYAEIEKTFQTFDDLYFAEVQTPMDDFLKGIFKSDNIWQPLKLNYKDKINFVKACQIKVDGLRVLQYLRYKQQFVKATNEECLIHFLNDSLNGDEMRNLEIDKDFNFETAAIENLDNLRNLLFKMELGVRKEKKTTQLF